MNKGIAVVGLCVVFAGFLAGVLQWNTPLEISAEAEFAWVMAAIYGGVLAVALSRRK